MFPYNVECCNKEICVSVWLAEKIMKQFFNLFNFTETQDFTVMI